MSQSSNRKLVAHEIFCFLSVVLGLCFAQGEYSSAWAKDNLKKRKEETKLLDVEKQVDDTLRKQKVEEKQAEREAATMIPNPPPNYVDPFDTQWSLQCRPDQNNCFEQPKMKVRPKRNDGLELGK